MTVNETKYTVTRIIREAARYFEKWQINPRLCTLGIKNMKELQESIIPTIKYFSTPYGNLRIRLEAEFEDCVVVYG